MLDDPKQCPFCRPNNANIIAEHEGAYLMRAVTPQGVVVPNRYQIVPFRHTTTLRLLPPGMTEQKWILLEQIPEIAGGADFNLSLNMGEAAGQRVAHVHEWVIVRTDSLGIGMSAMIDRLTSRQELTPSWRKPVCHEDPDPQY